MKRIRPLLNRLVNELQLIQGSMELGDSEASLKSICRAKGLCDELHSVISNIIEQRQTELRTAKKKKR
jgi:hypothetical protein